MALRNIYFNKTFQFSNNEMFNNRITKWLKFISSEYLKLRPIIFVYSHVADIFYKVIKKELRDVRILFEWNKIKILIQYWVIQINVSLENDTLIEYSLFYACWYQSVKILVILITQSHKKNEVLTRGSDICNPMYFLSLNPIPRSEIALHVLNCPHVPKMASIGPEIWFPALGEVEGAFWS